MKRRIFAFILLVALLIASVPFSASADSKTVTLNGINTSRYTDNLVVYTPARGTYTGTNAYGYEVTVENGIVTKVGGNNSYIPANGFVVSGHGTAETWLRENVTLGMKVTYTTGVVKTLTVMSDADTVKYVVTAARDKAAKAKAYAENACLIYDETADKRFDSAEMRYNALTSSSTDSEITSLAEEYTAIATLYREREVSEYRGLWLRPTQKSASEVEQYVRKCYENGINMISIETLYDSTMICPMPSDSYFVQNPSFGGFDVLGAFVSSCHRYGIELHCWMPVFFSAITTDTYYSKSVAVKKPEWQLKTDKGSALYSDETNGMVFLNPASSEVQDFLIKTYKYILEKYEIDGFQLDYIRYRDRTTNDDYGYNSETIEAFKNSYPQYKNYSITYNTRANYWNDWVSFRASKVTEFVKKMRDLIDEVAPDVILSADVGPSLDSAYSNLYQNSAYWMQQNWLDMIHPMAYGENYAPYIEPFFNYADAGCLVVPGLGIFMDEFDADDMVIQAQQMADIGCNGVVYFESVSFFQKKTGETLTSTIYTKHSVAPSRNNANTIKAILERISERVSLAVNLGKISWQVGNDVTWTVNNALAELEAKNAYESAGEIKYIADTVKQYVSTGELYDRLLIDLEFAYAAALRDQGIDVITEENLMTDEIPSDAVGATQLIIDKVNGKITGEDSSLITDLNGSYNLNYAFVMLLKPVGGNVYELVESHENVGTVKKFSTTVTDGMLYAAFHSDGTGSGLARKNLAKSLTKGTRLTLFGVDLASGGFTSLKPMLYVTPVEVCEHSYNAVVTAPTCRTGGYTTYTCSKCGDRYVGEHTLPDSNAHNLGEAATCTKAQTCLDCGTTIKPMLDHDYDEIVTAPTCEDEGYTTYDCKNCTHSYVDDYVDALGHKHVGVVTDPTCDEEGYTTYTCSVCGDSYVDDYVDAHGHTEGEWETLENGSQELRCEVCGDILQTKPYVPEVDYDVNNDGKFNMFDYLTIKSVVMNGTDDEELLARADVNGDGRINLFDYVAIKGAYFNQ